MTAPRDRDRKWPSVNQSGGRRDWQADAACRDLDPELFYEPSHEAAAKAACAGCVVIGECREYAIDRLEFGVWGGLNEAERAAVRRGEILAPPRRVRPSRGNGADHAWLRRQAELEATA
jgi:WhiB family redox-sensing transcriptional regulator